MKGFSSAFRQSSTPYGFGRGLAVHRRSPLRPLLTLSPLFDWSLVKSVRDFRILLRGMLKVALATGRAIGWPAVPCSMNGDPKRATSWPLIDTNGLPLHPKHSCGLGFKPRSDFAVRRDPVTNETLCEWSELISHGCLNWHQGSAGTPPWGILPLELPYYLFDLSNLNVDKKDGNSHAGGGSLSLREVVLGLRREGTETVASDPSFAQDQTQDETQDRILAQDHYLGLTVAVLRTSTQGYSSSHDDSKGSSSYGRHVAIIDLSEAPLFNHTLSHIGASALIPRVNATMLRAKLNSSYGHHGDEAVRGALTLHWHMVAVVGSGSRTMTTSTISPGPDILLIEAPLDAWIEEDSPEAAWLRPQLDITQLMGSNCAAVRDKVNCLN